MGTLLVGRYLDGTVRRRPFGEYISAEKIFHAIPTIGFGSVEFVSAKPATLLFCSIVGGIHASSQLAADTRDFLISSLLTFENDCELAMGKHRQKLSSLIENPKLINAVAVLDAGVRAAREIDDSVYSEIYRMVVHFVEGENPAIWPVKAAAAVHFGEGHYDTAVTFIKKLPELFASDFSFQKLALCFGSLSALLPQFPANSPIPVFLIWGGMLAACHSNKMLQRSGLELLLRAVPIALSHGGFDTVVRSREVSSHLAQGISAFEEEMGINLTANFPHGFAIALRKALDEPETRPSAVYLLKLCISASPAATGVFFFVPLIAYAVEDPIVVLASIAPECASVPEFLFTGFGERPPEEQADIVSYLSMIFGDRYCAHRMEIIGDCLIWGVDRYPAVFSGLKKETVEKCWKMMAAEKNPARLDKLAAVAAAFFSLPQAKTSIRITKSKLVPDNTLGTYIGGVVTGVSEVLNMDLKLPLFSA
jgi:hypothetical protein